MTDTWIDLAEGEPELPVPIADLSHHSRKWFPSEGIEAYRDRWRALLTKERSEAERACAKMSEEVSQTLGKALGYPWFKDDQKNFPGTTEADGVCVGDHVAETLATEAAALIAARDAEIAALKAREQPVPEGAFRVGHRVPRNVYCSDEPLFMAATAGEAAWLVALLNRGLASAPAPDSTTNEAKP